MRRFISFPILFVWIIRAALHWCGVKTAGGVTCPRATELWLRPEAVLKNPLLLKTDAHISGRWVVAVDAQAFALRKGATLRCGGKRRKLAGSPERL
jgi:hypothetical protein